MACPIFEFQTHPNINDDYPLVEHPMEKKQQILYGISKYGIYIYYIYICILYSNPQKDAEKFQNVGPMTFTYILSHISSCSTFLSMTWGCYV